MNAGKRGRPFQYPEPFIAWMACIHVFLQMPYRQMEGFVRKLATFIPGFTAADYTTLFRRIQRLDLSLKVTPEFLAEDVIIVVDSTGIKVTNRGEWLRRSGESGATGSQGACHDRRRDQSGPRPGGHR